MDSINKGYMGFSEGMLYGMGITSNNYKEVDWKRVKDFIEENKDSLESVYAGLAEDWGYTSGEVWNSNDGYIPQEDTYVYACSKWATPSIEVYYKDGKTSMFECWREGGNPNSYFTFD